MSLKAVCWAVNQENLKPAEKVVLIQLCNHANEDTFDPKDNTYSACPRQATLAKKVNLTRRTVNSVIHRLEKMGFLTVIHRKDEYGEPLSNVYKINIDVQIGQILKKKSTAQVGENISQGGENISQGERKKSHENGKNFTEVGAKISHKETGYFKTGSETRDTRHAEKIHPVDDRVKFEMPLDWQPNEESFLAYCAMSGVDPKSIKPVELEEFRRYWSGEHAIHTQSQWENKYVVSLRRNRAYPATKNAGSTPQTFEPVELIPEEEQARRNKVVELESNTFNLRQEIQHMQKLIESSPKDAAAPLEEQLANLKHELSTVELQIDELEVI